MRGPVEGEKGHPWVPGTAPETCVCTTEGMGGQCGHTFQDLAFNMGESPYFRIKAAEARAAPSSLVPHTVSRSLHPPRARLLGGHPEMFPVSSCIPCRDRALTDPRRVRMGHPQTSTLGCGVPGG